MGTVLMSVFKRIQGDGAARFWALSLLVGLLTPAGLAAQDGPQPQIPKDEDGLVTPELRAKMQRDMSPFTLTGSADLAMMGMRSRSSFVHSFANDGPNDYYFVLSSSIITETNTPTGEAQFYFAGPIWGGAPASEWNEHRQQVSSLNNATGNGFTSRWNLNAWFLRFPNDWRAADGQLGTVHSGAVATTDGTCTDFSADFMNEGAPLGAASDCPATWGSEQFAGASKRITFQAWEEYFNQAGAQNFNWDWWRVPDEFVSEDQLLGDFQHYAAIQDWTSDVLLEFGSVIPGQSGDPSTAGWPLGLTIEYDAFSFQLPDVQKTTYWRSMVINESEKVYGVGLDYDSLYLGVQAGFLMNLQDAAVYFRPELGGLLANNNGTNPACNDARSPEGVGGCQFGSSSAGFGQGATAILVLNSPLGDLRNKLFTTEGSPFFAPDHPRAGDTITFNQGRIGAFGSVWGGGGIVTRSPRADVGFHSAVPEWILDGRAEADISAGTWADGFRNFDYPERTPRINWLQPEADGWDWNRDGVVDTIHVHSCLDADLGGPEGCSELWSDTLPGRLNNNDSNFGGFLGFGPFPLAAGDTTRFTLAYVGGNSRSDIESNVRNTIGFYQRSFLGPSAATPPNILTGEGPGAGGGVSVGTGDRGRTGGTGVQVFFDDSAEEFEDVFMLLQAQQFEGTQLAEDNPNLVDTIRAIARNNVEAIHIFKSCDGGETFTNDNNCFGQNDIAVDDRGNQIGLGWQPFETLEPDENGRFPNTFTDNAVTAGKTYLYSFVTETRGLTLNVVARNDQGDPIVQELEIAPKLFSPLTTSLGDPNVVSVYVPASRQAGAEDASVEFTAEDPETPVEFHDVEVQLTGRIPNTLQNNRLVFGDSVVVNEVSQGPEGPVNSTVDLFRTVVTSLDGGATTERVVIDSEQFTTGNPAGVDVEGGTTTTEPQGEGTVTTTVFADELTVVALGPNGEPLFASSGLEGSGTTPGNFLGRSDFPGWLLDIDNSGVGSWVSTNWLAQVTPDSVAEMRGFGSPDLTWLREIAGATGATFGEYFFEFADREFGPAGLFRINISDPVQTEQALAESLSQRAVATTTSTSEEVAEAMGVDAADLASVKLPFTVQQQTPQRPVTVAMLAESKRDSIPLGQGTDQISVAVPPDQWVPGEALVFLEPVQRFATDVSDGGTEFVVTQNGQPVTTDALTVTWDPAVLGCSNRTTCNPVQGGTRGADNSPHLPVEPQTQMLRTRYQNPIDQQSQFAFNVNKSLEGKDVTDLDPEDFDDIKVVPNPYVMFSVFEQQNAQRRIMFMGLPPEGTIEIFTVSGQFVQRITYDEDDLAGNGDLYWDMRTFENTEAASGLYLFVLEGTLPASGKSVRKLGKFVIIR